MFSEGLYSVLFLMFLFQPFTQLLLMGLCFGVYFPVYGILIRGAPLWKFGGAP